MGEELPLEFEFVEGGEEKALEALAEFLVAAWLRQREQGEGT